MKKSYILYVIIAIVAGIACNKVETNDQPVSTEKENVYDVIYATAEATKTIMVGSGINGHIEWVAGDEVVVYTLYKGGQQIDTYSYKAENSGGSASFSQYEVIKKISSDAQQTSHRFFTAAFPRESAINCTHEYVLTLSVPNVQDGSFSNVACAGISRELNAGSVTELNKQYLFTAVSSVIKLTVPASLNAKSIYIKSDKDLCGQFKVKYNTTTGAWDNQGSNTNTSKSILVQKRVNGELQTLSGDIYVALLPSTAESQITVSVISGNKFDCKTSTVPSLTSNCIVDFGTVHNLSIDKSVSRFQCDGSGSYVEFAKGNLQYLMKKKDGLVTGSWKIASNQYDFVGGTEGKNKYGNLGEYSNNPTGTVKNNDYLLDILQNGGENMIDLLSYGCTGYNDGKFDYAPTNIMSDVASGTQYAYGKDLDDNTDWGKYLTTNGRTISGLEGDKWRTLAASEWKYIFDNNKYASVTVCNVSGMMLLPEFFVDPYVNSYPFTTGNSYGSDEEEHKWSLMEDAGAVFFPNAGCRTTSNNTMTYTNTWQYWSSTYSYKSGSSTYTRAGMYFSNNTITGLNGGNSGCAVRLVRDVE